MPLGIGVDGLSIPFKPEGGDPYAWDGNAYSMLFDGVDEGFLTAQDPNFDPVGAFSGVAWVKVVDTVGTLQTIASHDSTAGASRGWLVYTNGSAGSNKVNMVIWNTNGTQNTLSEAVAGGFNDGSWHMLAWTYTGDTATNGFKLYIDGSLDNQMTTGSTGIRTYTGVNDKLSIGINSISSGTWAANAYIDEVAFWDSVLTPTDITNIYNSGTPVDLSGYSPNTWWRMGDFGAWDGSDWTLPNIIDAGTDDMISTNMEEADRSVDVP